MDIRRELFGDEDILAGFDVSRYPLDLDGWCAGPEVFERLIEESERACVDGPPGLVIEVGTWKGLSTSYMATALERLSPRSETLIVCVDVWLGATEFWINRNDVRRYKALELVNGYPSVYYRFLANMAHLGLSHRVVPFPQTSANAARVLRAVFDRTGYPGASLVYVDGSHEYDDVRADLYAYDSLVRSDGILFGDDYCAHWAGVVRAVDERACETNRVVVTRRLENEGQAPSDYWALVTRNGVVMNSLFAAGWRAA